MKTDEHFVGRLAAALRAVRAEREAKNGDLARALGTSQQTVSGWFTGNGPAIRADALYLLCAELGTDPGDLFARAAKV